VVLVCQGRAAADGRFAVGRFSDPVAWQLLDQAERTVVEQVRAEQPPSNGSGRITYELVRRTALLMVPRTLAIDTAVREHGARQVVILGAGLDARAWRMPDLASVTVYEVDHPASQLDKQRRLGGLEPAVRSVVPVAVDLEHDALAPALEPTGFDTSAATTWVWEGVVPYLTARAVEATVSQLAELAGTGSLLVVNYQARSLAASVMRRGMRLVSRLARQQDPLANEPWRCTWSPDTMRTMLAGNGFDVTADDDLLTLADGLGLPSGADASLRNGRLAVAVRR